MAENPLGKAVVYPQRYAPELLVPIPRDLNRATLGLGNNLSFTGADIWNVYECSWLNEKGRPCAAVLRLVIPCTTPNIVESKSLKLYFNSLNQERFADETVVLNTIKADLEKILEGQILLSLISLEGFDGHTQPVTGTCLDHLDIEVSAESPDSSLLKAEAGTLSVNEVVYSNLFRSLCPITSQPDWATITICYQGSPISHESLLRYLVSYRQHNDYHEHCAERIFCDIQNSCKPESLTVEANFLRRGGIDINPVRTTEAGGNYQDFPRYIRQ